MNKPNFVTADGRATTTILCQNIRNHTGVFPQRPMDGKPGEPNKSQVQADDVKKFDSVLTTSEGSTGGDRDSGIIRIM